MLYPLKFKPRIKERIWGGSAILAKRKSACARLPKDKLYFTVFEGNEDAPRDEEAFNYWVEAGVEKDHIFFLSKKHNWWGPAGQTGPCGPDTEMFIDTGKEKCCPDCNPSCSCGKYVEIWNDVFMQYNKTKEGTFEPLKQKNVDTVVVFVYNNIVI